VPAPRVIYVIPGCSDGIATADSDLYTATTMIGHHHFTAMVIDRDIVTVPRSSRKPRGRRLPGALSKRLRLRIGVVLAFVCPAWAMGAAQPRGVPLPPKAVQGTSDSSPAKGITAPTEDNPEATAAEATGPISVAETVSDDSVKRKLEKLLPKYPGVRAIGVEVEDGVVTLTGHVADNDVRERLREFVRRVQGVNLVLNQTKTDAQVLTASQYALYRIGGYWDVISRKWLLWLFAIGLVLGALGLARLFKRYGERFLALFTGNALLRSLLGSVVAALIVIGGILSALHLLGMTETVLSSLGLAGFVALAIGFAFRDIAENFVASIMLGLRRPFRVGDFIEVAGKSGVVKSLNTRATVLVTLDGSTVRIPNAVILFKEILVNKSASTIVRASFDVIVPWNASIATATEAITCALREHEGFADDPPPRTLLEAIEPGGIRLRSYFWFPGRGVDTGKLLSDARLAAKVALQKAGITPAPAPVIVQVSGEGPPGSPRSQSGTTSAGLQTAATTEQVQANLLHDAEAATIASSQLPEDQENEISHALNVAGTEVSDEGTNLIGEQRRQR
jgi:small-conductance mechanosensitive channel